MAIRTATLLDDAASLSDLRDRVLAYVGDVGLADKFAALADGIVLRDGRGYAAARRSHGTFRLVDPEFYVGDRDQRAHQGLVPLSLGESIDNQVAAGASCLLAPSRFPRERDTNAIHGLLERGAAFMEEAARLAPDLPAVVPVIIRYDELADRRWTEPVRSSGLPVATVFAGFGDPLSDASQLEGAVELVQAAAFAFVMRCDASAGGLMALGAATSSIGTSTAVRHLWLPRRGGRSAAPKRSVFVPATANWMHVDHFVDASLDPRSHTVFRCSCEVCGPDGDVRDLVGANDETQDLHSAAASIGLVRDVLSSPNRVEKWRQICEHAAASYDELASAGVSGPAPPGVLTAWLRLFR